jgi:tetratricopeptide (TPR) repeat protein/2-polyprenyl-3-methyl-5-hydroxy-6-metoxy-1,4-benzoquinol methylase
MSTERERSITDLLQRAATELEHRRPAQAEAALEAVLRLHPDHFDALHELGLLACDARNPHRGIAFFRRALAVRPDHAGAHCNLGIACKEANRLADALASYDAAIALRPAFAEAHYNRGNALKELVRLEEAVESYGRALELKPGFAASHANRGIALLELGRADEALADFDRAVILRPNHAPAHCNRGNALAELGRAEEAVKSYERALALTPALIEGHINLGNALMALGRGEQALASFLRALRIAPESPDALKSISALLAQAEPGVVSAEMRSVIIRCLESQRLESESVAAASAAVMLQDLKQPLSLGKPAELATLDRLTHGLLGAHLRNAPVPDLRLEALLAQARAQLLVGPGSGGAGAELQGSDLEALIALARQGFLNEYLWPAQPEEWKRVGALEASVVQAIRDDKSPAMRDLLLLGAYRPLHEVAEIRNWCERVVERLPAPIKPTLIRLVIEPVREAELAAHIESLTAIEDSVSLAVQSQYEENPYPRWDAITLARPVRYTQQILKEIAPNRPPIDATSETPRVLVAGCGSGKQPLYSAMRFSGARVTAVDLSRASLGYAKRKALDMRLSNVRFAQADILQLPQGGEPYDVIECSGVLHHMADPEAGLAALLRLLRPGGFIKLGLYSDLARQPVVRLRAAIAEIGAIPRSREGIRELRKALIDADSEDLRMLRRTRDFYTTSTVRDLLLHVQEHRYSLPRLANLIERARLEFLGFMLADPQHKLRYARRFPEDAGCIDLCNWHRVEIDHPHTFTGMYQFWCRKPA